MIVQMNAFVIFYLDVTCKWLMGSSLRCWLHKYQPGCKTAHPLHILSEDKTYGFMKKKIMPES